MTLFLVDTSAWVELLRDTGSRACSRVAELLEQPESVAITQPVLMEVLAGAVDERALEALEAVTSSLVVLDLRLEEDFHAAAAAFREVRRTGRTVRSLVDCLIAVVALRAGATVVHRDRDYDVLAEVLHGLRVERV